MIAFIREHKDQRVTSPDGLVGLRWGVEPMCTVLAEHGINISPATYYEWVDKQPTRQQLRNVEVTELIRAEREHPKTGRFAATLGSRKMWLRLRGKGHDAARCTVERLMRDNGAEGAAYGSKHRTTIPDPTHLRFPDLADRNFSPAQPNRLWVADFTYCPTWTGMVYVAFVVDAYARRIVGWRVAKRMTTELVLDAVEHAFFTRAQQGITDLSGLVAHSDAWSVHRHCIHPAPGRRGRRPVRRVSRRRLGPGPGTDHRRVFQERTHSPAGPRAQHRACRDRHPGLGPLVQHRAAARVPRRPHPRGRRAASL